MSEQLHSNGAAPIRCLVLPLHSGALVVPNAMVAEVLHNQLLDAPRDNAPDWLSGNLQWQDNDELPVVSFETLCDQAAGEYDDRDTTVVVVHSLGDNPRLRHYGIRIADVPSFEFVDNTNLVAADDQSANNDFVASRVFIKGVQAVVPDLEELEALLASA